MLILPIDDLVDGTWIDAPRKRSNKKPAGRVEIDRDSVVGKNIIDVLPMSNTFESMERLFDTSSITTTPPFKADYTVWDSGTTYGVVYGDEESLNNLTYFSLTADVDITDATVAVGTDCFIVCKQDSSWYDGFGLHWDVVATEEVFRFHIFGTGIGDVECNSTGGMVKGRYKVTCTFDGSKGNNDKVRIYVDGVDVTVDGSSGVEATTTLSGNALRIGKKHSSPFSPFEGNIHSIIFHKETLSAEVVSNWHENFYGSFLKKVTQQKIYVPPTRYDATQLPYKVTRTESAAAFDTTHDQWLSLPFTVKRLPLSMGGWFRDVDAVADDRCMMQICYTAAADEYFRIGLGEDGQSGRVVIVWGAGSEQAQTSVNRVLGEWTCLVGSFVFDDYRQVSQNGEPFVVNTLELLGGSMHSGINELSIGRENDSSPGDDWDGDLAHLWVYDGNVSQEQNVRLSKGDSPLDVFPEHSRLAYMPLTGPPPWKNIGGWQPGTLTDESAANNVTRVPGIPITKEKSVPILSRIDHGAFLPDRRMESPRMMQKGKKPTGEVELDKEATPHSIVAYLPFLEKHVGQTPARTYDFINGRTFQPNTGSAAVITPRGVETFGSSGDYFEYVPKGYMTLTEGAKFVRICIGFMMKSIHGVENDNNTLLSFYGMGGANNSLLLRVNPNGTIEAGGRGASADSYQNSGEAGTILAGVFYRFEIWMDFGGDAIYTFLDGKPLHTTTGLSFTSPSEVGSSNEKDGIGGMDTAGDTRYSDAVISYVIVQKDSFEPRSLSQDPYQFLVPK